MAHDVLGTSQRSPAHAWSPDLYHRAEIAAYRREAVAIADALGSVSPYLDARLRARIAAYPPPADDTTPFTGRKAELH